VPLTGEQLDYEEYWFGNIYIGTKPQPFHGMAFPASSPSRFITLGLMQSFSILATASSSYLRLAVEPSARDIIFITQKQARPPRISQRPSTSKSHHLAQSIQAANMTTSSALAATFMYEEPFFFKIKCRYYARQAVHQNLGATNEISAEFEGVQFDGIMGMGFMESSEFGTPSVIETLFKQGDLNMFGFKLGSGSSELYLGGLNKALYVEDTMVWLSLTGKVCHVTLRSISLA
jgi:Eukaryotic aspartyl protease